MASWIVGLIALAPGLALGFFLWLERGKRADAEERALKAGVRVAGLVAEMKELNELYARATGRLKTAEKMVERKEIYIDLLESKLADEDPADLVDGLFAGNGVPPSEGNN